MVELADGRLLASRRWPGTGVPLVTLHGLFDCSLGWKHVAAATRRPCVAFDLPGFGRSGMPAENRFARCRTDSQTRKIRKRVSARCAAQTRNARTAGRRRRRIRLPQRHALPATRV